jgi:hypothetical protein
MIAVSPRFEFDISEVVGGQRMPPASREAALAGLISAPAGREPTQPRQRVSCNLSFNVLVETPKRRKGRRRYFLAVVVVFQNSAINCYQIFFEYFLSLRITVRKIPEILLEDLI